MNDIEMMIADAKDDDNATAKRDQHYKTLARTFDWKSAKGMVSIRR